VNESYFFIHSTLQYVSLLKKLAGETALYGLSSILGRVLTFVFLTPFLTRVFANDQAQIGIQSDLYAWTAFLMVIFTYRMETAFFRFGSDKKERATAYKTAKTALVVSSVALTTLLVVLAQPIANWLEYPQHSSYVIWFALILGFDALCAVPFAFLRLEGKALRFAVIKLSNLFIHLGFVLFFLKVMPVYFPNWYDGGMGIGYVFIANLVASGATLLLLLPTYWSHPKETETLDDRILMAPPIFDKGLLQKMFWYALPLVFAGFAGIINEVLDRILLKNMLEGDVDYRLAQLGIYGSCYKIAIMMNLFTQAFNYAAEPFFFRNAKKEYANKLYGQIALLFALVGCLGFLGVMLFMDIAQYFVAASYREGLVIVPVLLLANLCLGLYYNIAIWYKLSNQTKYGAYIAVTGALITIGANFVLIPLMPQFGYPGYLGSAWATLFCYTTMLLLAYVLGQKHYPIDYPVGKIAGYILTAVLFYLLYAFLLKSYVRAESIGSYALSLVVFLAYIVCIWIKDGQNIKNIIQKSPVD
jgi:O-antigen/teichoic acid export membrane protein